MTLPVVLMVGEKPSIARAVAMYAAPEGMEVVTRDSTVSRSLPVHEFEGSFAGTRVLFRVTAVIGHVYSLDFDPQFQSWDATPPRDLFSVATVTKKRANPKSRVCKHLQAEAKGAAAVVLWLDCDREGENICFEVLDNVRDRLVPHKAFASRTVFRARFSAVTRSEVARAMSSLVEPNPDEAAAVDARQELDLRIGVAFTRFQTRHLTAKYGNLPSELISYGPCQTPTLNFVVARRDAINAFQPETYWQLMPRFSPPGGGALISLDWTRGRVFDAAVVQAYAAALDGATAALCTSVSRKRKKKPRPIALNTVGLLKVCSAGLGIGPKAAMAVAERLYIDGYISYPRTETTAYPPGFELHALLEEQRRSRVWGGYVTSLLRSGLAPSRAGVDAGDHPPIVPMRAASEDELVGDAWRVYDYVARHFIATVSPDCVVEHQTAAFSIAAPSGETELFHVKGLIVIDEGFCALLPHLMPAGKALPPLSPETEYTLTDIVVRSGETSPPGLLSESELISLMERHSIGTDASCPTHINNIVERGYAKVVAGRRLEPTTLGIVLIHSYYKIDPELVLPTVRSSVESQLDLVASGVADKDAVVAHCIAAFAAKFDFFVDSVSLMDSLFEANYAPVADAGKSLSRCGKCKYVMRLMYRPSRLHCPRCNETYSLPNNGIIKLFQEKTCPLDGFELVLYSLGKKGARYLVCPACYTNRPFEPPTFADGMSCDSCQAAGCGYAGIHFSVGPCSAAGVRAVADDDSPGCPGTLMLEPMSAPVWKLHCTGCNVIVTLPDCAHDVKVLTGDDPCGGCGANLFAIEFHKDKLPLPGLARLNGCIFCDELLAPGTRVVRGKTKHQMFKRGRGRGRGRRKRGKLDHLLRH
ncbi:DNA topoisomerase [Thecamonas trahens ATCC 50062]|uniref:DNA topoisomerase n=1 Tax=Thecamonas trahens ATCC 50062 TaxID=461836 RepID=A0A0L0D1L8_THETB|nr:DNA topoisomerase [Thecamonas trahens ATCC 50062]KNC46096.1 DNA topoisomerase [Thecamonas trahens ATCC 50062]|eukprot:XP_013763074.1 DNA topoisomerase [Thecamonas trahens ATCC 50062]